MDIIADNFGASNNFAIPFIEAVKSANSGDNIVFENKEYHFYKDYCSSKVIHMTNTDSFKNPKKYFAMLMENVSDLTIDGNGATFVIHGDICSLAILNCKNIKLKNFTIKYASPNNVELKVIENNGRTVLYEIPESTLWYTKGRNVYFFEQSPFTKKNYWEFKNDSNSHNSVCHDDKDVFRTLHPVSAFSAVRSVKRKSQTELEIKYFYKRKFKVGSVYTFSENKNRNTCGVFVNESENISAENITVNYLAGFGWLSQMCNNVSFESVKFEPCENHHVSAFADLIHVCGCKGDIKINNCSFCHPHDDAINIHGAFLRFKEKVNSNTAVFEFVHRQQGGYRAFYEGDKVAFYYRNNLEKFDGEYVVKKAVDDIEGKTVTLEFETPLPGNIEAKFLAQNNVVAENISYCPNVEISNCEFFAIPTRGILCTTSGKVRIHNNSFTHISMADIFISNDAADWYESGPVRDVEIYSNKFVLQKSKQYEQPDCPAILVKPITLSRRVTIPVHKNISIYDNDFEIGRDKPIVANGVENIKITDNRFVGCDEIVLNNCK